MRRAVLILLPVLASASLGACGERAGALAPPEAKKSVPADPALEMEELHRNIRATKHNDLRTRAVPKSAS